MDFEVLGEEESRLSFHTLEIYLRNRRRQLQDWDANPPHWLGIFVLFVAVFECLLGWRLLNGVGLTRTLFPHTLIVALSLVLIEIGLARIAAEVAGFFSKKGSVSTAVTFFNLGLLPLFLILPLAVAAYSNQKLRIWALFGWIILFVKTLGNWRESLEVSFELSRFQSTLVIYLATVLSLLMLLLAAYIGFLSSLTQFLN